MLTPQTVRSRKAINSKYNANYTLTVNGTLACSGQMTGNMFFCAGKVNANGTKAFTSSRGLTGFTCSVSSNVYQITFNSSHTSANYVIQIRGQGAVATVSSSVVPTATGFQVVLYRASTAGATVAQPVFVTVLHCNHILILFVRTDKINIVQQSV